MTHSSDPTCGNCGKPVSATDVICPHCDALLAAYQSPGGSTVGATTATTPVTEMTEETPGPVSVTTNQPSPAIAEAYAPPPITPTPAPPLPTAPIRPAPSPLRGDSRLAAAASRSTSEIADELTEMARIDSSFAKSVEVQAKQAIVESDSVASVKPEPASKPTPKPERPQARSAPVRAKHVDRASKPAEAGKWQNTADQRGENPDPNRTLNPPVPPRSGISMKTANASESESTTQPTPRALASRKNTVAVIAFVVIVAIVFRSPGAFFFLALAIGLVFVFFRMAIKATKSNSRPTTRMPYDKQNRRKRDR